MGDSDQTLSEYLACPGGGGITLPTKIQKVLHDARADAFDAKTNTTRLGGVVNTLAT